MKDIEVSIIRRIIDFTTKSPGWAVLILIVFILLVAIGILAFDTWKTYKRSLKEQEKNKKLIKECGSNCPLNTDKEKIILLDNIRKRLDETISIGELISQNNRIIKEIKNIETSIYEAFPITSELMKALLAESKHSESMVSLLERILEQQTGINKKLETPLHSEGLSLLLERILDDQDKIKKELIQKSEK